MPFEIKLFQKIEIENPNIQYQVQVQGCIMGSTSYPTHIPFAPYQFAKFEVTGEAKGQSLIVGPTTYHSHPFRSMSIDHPIPGILLFFKNWPWTSKVKVTAQGRRASLQTEGYAKFTKLILQWIPDPGNNTLAYADLGAMAAAAEDCDIYFTTEQDDTTTQPSPWESPTNRL